MCLITLSNWPTRIKKDMIVYKAVSQPSYVPKNKARSLIQNFEYTEGVVYKTKMRIADCVFAEESGPLSYDNEADRCLFEYLDKKQLSYLTMVNVISEGFHSAKDPNRLENGWIRKFLIPKGSYIYRDYSGLIVSNQIQLLPQD